MSCYQFTPTHKAIHMITMRNVHFFALMAVLVLPQGSNCDIQLVNNGYENVNIFIAGSVEEDPKLIQRIKEVFTNTSSLLFKATNNRAYIRNVKIVIPKKWKHTATYSKLPSISKFGEHIRVDRMNKAKGDAPYVRGHLACGKPGWFMHLTPGFLNAVGETDFGSHANAIVHEWGHLRWGLFDEYASIQYPGSMDPSKKIQFYNENGQWRPVTCSREITGGAYRGGCDVRKPCNLNSITIPSQCAFCPDLHQTAKTSFMSSQWIRSLEGFCDEDNASTEPARRHNSRVPNAQNYYCNGQSAWEVMRDHEDFRDGHNPAASNDLITEPTFEVIQETGKVRVFVYDVSGSMHGEIDDISSRGHRTYYSIRGCVARGNTTLGFLSLDEISAYLTLTYTHILSMNSDQYQYPTKYISDETGTRIGTKIKQQKLASYVVIDNVIETGSWLGLVKFSSYATVLAHLTEITNKRIRSQMKASVPTYAGGNTNIYAGLIQAVTVIQDGPFSTKGTEIILLSDGESDPYLHIIPTLQEKGITVHTISITQQADTNMAKLAEETGGKSYTYLETKSVSFVDVLTQAISAGTSDDETVEKIFGTTYVISSASSLNDYFTIDDGLGNTTTITIIRNGAWGSITLDITGPDGSFYTNTANDEIMSVQLDDNTPVGKYDFTISTTSNSDIKIEISITTLPISDEVEVVRVTSFFSNQTLDFSDKEELRLFASVEKAGNPVLNASVSVVLAGDSSFTSRELVMKDHGLGADLTANDGVYSVYMLKSYFTENDRYNVKVAVAGDTGTFIFTPANIRTDNSASLPGTGKDVEYTPVPLDEFQRQSIPGEITVVNYRSVGDLTPPARITDLEVESITSSNDKEDQTLTYTFVWTAVGDDMDVGKATKYDMRMNTDDRYVRHHFNNCSDVPVNLNKPKTSGETERYVVTFSITDCNGTCFLAVRASDDSGLKGEVSNLVNVDINFSYEPEQIFPNDDDDDNDGVTTAKTQNTNDLSDKAIYGIAGGAIVCVVVVVVVSLVLVNRRKLKKINSRNPERQVHRNNFRMEIEESAP